MTAKKKQNGMKPWIIALSAGVAVTLATSLVAAAFGAKMLVSPSAALYMGGACLAAGTLTAAFLGGKQGGFIGGLAVGAALTAVFIVIAIIGGGLGLIMPLSALGGTVCGAAMSQSKKGVSKRRLKSVKKQHTRRK